MVRIAIDARKWRDYGIGTYVRNLVRHLARIDRDTMYFILCDPLDENVLRAIGTNFVPLVETARGYSVEELLTIPRRLRKLGVDLYHSPHYVLPLRCPSPAVVTIHDCIHLRFPEYLPNRLAHSYAKYMIGHAVRTAARVLTVSEASRDDILYFFPKTDPARLDVVPNAIDEAFLVVPSEGELERVRERYQIRGRFVLYVGNIKPHKNLDRLVKAFAIVKRRPGNRDLKFVVIGEEAAGYASLRRAVETAGVRQDVRFFGFVPDPTLAALYRLSEVFAFPSLYEGFGLPPLEAMACGAPVVTSRISSLPEVVGDAAVLVDPRNVEEIAHGIIRVLEDSTLRQTLVARGAERVRRFSWDRSVRAIRRTYLLALGLPHTESQTVA